MLGRQNRELAYSRSLLSNHIGQLQLAIRNVRQENVRLREALCSVLRYHGLIAGVVRGVVGDVDIEGDPVVATQNIDPNMHDNPLIPAASASEIVDDYHSPVAKPWSQQQQQSPVLSSAEAVVTKQKRVHKEAWKKHLLSLTPIAEERNQNMVKHETISQQSCQHQPEPLYQSKTRRSKVQKSYRLPSLKQKLRKGDPFTYT